MDETGDHHFTWNKPHSERKGYMLSFIYGL
jgi:hypothetical protein